jgi:four helix bundle protein
MIESILERKASIVVKQILTESIAIKTRHHQFEIASQLIRSSTSILMNIEEALVAQSRRDFISKLCISRKELRETMKWLELIDHISCIEKSILVSIVAQLTEVYKMLNSSISTAAKNAMK